MTIVIQDGALRRVPNAERLKASLDLMHQTKLVLGQPYDALLLRCSRVGKVGRRVVVFQRLREWRVGGGVWTGLGRMRSGVFVCTAVGSIRTWRTFFVVLLYVLDVANALGIKLRRLVGCRRDIMLFSYIVMKGSIGKSKW
jgi:hypothetical protein